MTDDSGVPLPWPERLQYSLLPDINGDIDMLMPIFNLKAPALPLKRQILTRATPNGHPLITS